MEEKAPAIAVAKIEEKENVLTYDIKEEETPVITVATVEEKESLPTETNYF